MKKSFLRKLSFSFVLFAFSSVAVFAQNDLPTLKSKWQNLLTGGNLDSSQPIIASYIEEVNTKATAVWNAMIKKPNGTDTRTCIFPQYPITSRDRTGSSEITMTYDLLKSLALAYKISGTDFSGRADVFAELIGALDMMASKHYSVANTTSGTGTSLGGNSYGNWYDWRIGTPLRYNDVLTILSDELTDQQMTAYLAPVLSNNKAVDNTGANLTWIAGIVAQAGVLSGDSALIAKAVTALKNVFPYVTSGDGYYADGSFVQHTNYAYTGGYGKALLCTISPLMYVLKGSSWDISYSNQIENNFYDMLTKAYEPLIYGGRFMDMSREREISRLANQDHIPGRQAIRAFVLMLDVLPAERKPYIESLLKEWLSNPVVLQLVCSDPMEGFLEYQLQPLAMVKALQIVQNDDITPRGELIAHRTFASMDRVVHLQNKYAFGIAMTSTRIKNTEGTNDEGLRLWHIGDGMTYLYNKDKSLYADHFWATVDKQRLPGTTVTRVSRGTKDAYGTFNSYTWVGGADLDEYGVAGMQFKGLGTGTSRTLDAKKSWFMFDDEIVALGTDIKLASGSAPVETIVDNRKIKPDFSNKITINGQEITRQGEDAPDTVFETLALKATTVATSGSNVVADKTLSVQPSGVVTIEFDVKVPGAADFLAVKIFGKGDGDTSNKLLNFLTMRAGYLAQRINATGTAQDACPTVAATGENWNHVKLLIDLNAKTYNYYFNGEHAKTATAISGNSLTVNANLENHTFPETIGANGKITLFEVVTPNNGVGSILIDNIEISNVDGVAYTEDFESFTENSAIAANGWTVTQTDNGAGAGATVYKDQTTIAGTPASDDFNSSHLDTEWLHIEGAEGVDTHVGYYFPNRDSIEGLRELRTGKWSDVNTYAKFIDSETRSNCFATFWFKHGNAPTNAQYAYVILPGKTAEETAAYNDNPDIEILRQDANVHAVYEKTLKITGINFWTSGTFGHYTVNAPASLIVRENGDGTITLAVSNPPRAATSMTVTFDVPIEEVISLDEKVTASTNRIIINTSGALGKSFHATLRVNLSTDVALPNDSKNLQLHPNPVKQGQPVFLQSDSRNTEIFLYNITGQVLKKQTLDAGVTELDTSSLPSGTYLVSSGSCHSKLIVY